MISYSEIEEFRIGVMLDIELESLDYQTIAHVSRLSSPLAINIKKKRSYALRRYVNIRKICQIC